MANVNEERLRKGQSIKTIPKCSDGDGFKQTAIWDVNESKDFPTPVAGQYPKGFLDWAFRLTGAPRATTLHVCSGAQSGAIGGTRVDIRPEAMPDVVCDGRDMPFDAASFDAVFIDPPYTEAYAQVLYGTDYPRPAHLLKEAARCCRRTGVIGFLHFLVPNPPKGWEIRSIHGITTGTGFSIRAFTVFRPK